MRRGLPVLAAALLVAATALFLVEGPVAAQNGGWGTVKGQVVYGGANVPEPAKLDVNKDQVHCLAKGPIFSEEWVVNPKNKGVRWAFVWLAPAKGGSPLAIHPNLVKIKDPDVVLDQPVCRFEPHAVALRQGQNLIAKNSAPVAHNVHWTGHPLKNPGGNFIVPPTQSLTVKDLKADRFPVEVKCDIHPWMKAWVRVYDHPYFAVTDADGKFEIKDAPAGPCNLVIWHDSGYGPPYPMMPNQPHPGRDGTPIKVKAGGDTDVGKLELKP
jgi:hypothetical protein